ncbi:cell division protein FtsL [Candidatus Vallotiella sp. (ex Adelges kitamiensis)]|uniref:cell division protein FtsL n=1 Tax=Candidatus Vallotiella sp. (ex Adelges kitamiensis) TaxID=2864217 RepID=UPI001CE3AB2D|nr:cell division protein FtsL [Candidatus Vallotia sp. (ex Adelges kitamiensis)]
MIRLNFFLLIIMLTFEVGCALSVVSATNCYRELFVDLQYAQSKEYELRLNNVWLQYQRSALSKTSRIAHIAAVYLKMHPIVLSCTQYLNINSDRMQSDILPSNKTGPVASNLKEPGR